MSVKKTGVLVLAVVLVPAVSGFYFGTAGPAAAAPDLVVTNITADGSCHIVVTVANQGSALPDSVTQVTLQLYSSGAPLSGWTLAPSSLKAAGSSTTFTVPTFVVGPNSIIRADVSAPGLVESSTSNNSMTKALTCSPKLPDLALSVTVNPDCTKLIEIQNAGEGPALDGTWSTTVRRQVDGMPFNGLPLGTVDPGHALKYPGGKATYAEPAQFRAYASYDYAMDYPWQEYSKTNNRAQGRVPSACAGPRPVFDVRLTDVRLDSSCRLVFTVRNEGPSGAPPASAPVQFVKAGTSVGGWTVDFARLGTVGATTTGYGPFVRDTAAVQMRVLVDPRHLYPDSNASNNELRVMLKCGP